MPQQEILVDGELAFIWESDDDELERIGEEIAEAAEKIGVPPEAIAWNAARYLATTGGPFGGPAEVVHGEWAMYYMMDHLVGDPLPGKFRDHMARWNFTFDLSFVDDGSLSLGVKGDPVLIS